MRSKNHHPYYMRAAIFIFVAILAFSVNIAAHPLGNFTVNQHVGIEVERGRIRLRYVVDMAEIAALQELQRVDADKDGKPSSEELNRYLEQLAQSYPNGLAVTIDNVSVPLTLVAKNISLPPGQGGLPTLRVECEYTGAFQPAAGASDVRGLRFANTNYADRLGWRETIVVPSSGVNLFDSTAFSNSVSGELKKYPEELLVAPLNERKAELKFTSGAIPSGGTPLRSRDGRTTTAAPDRLAELLNVPEITPLVILIALLTAFGLGAVHALSPGHGKAIVGAYLVGTRGTPRHAVFLGLTVTITHTLGVFILGFITLFASEYILPERLFPVLSFISGGIVVAIGGSLFFRRLNSALGGAEFDHVHTFDGSSHTHSHGGRAHTHLPPGADGAPVTWRNLLGLGVSGGLLPCPSALVLLLSAIALDRTGLGLVLSVAFSLGLASTLTGVGLAFLYAGRLMKRPTESILLTRVLPIASAFVVLCLGIAICYGALTETNLVAELFAAEPDAGEMSRLSTASILLLGFVIGLKHAVEADHLAAVSAIVSERKSVLSSALVGGLWGIGHTLTLFIAGVAVILLQVRISERTALALEFGVALMLIALGANVIRKLARGDKLHLHQHAHGEYAHAHLHTHEDAVTEHAHEESEFSHHGLGFSIRPLIVGMVHGLAGSAALMLLVLSTIETPLVGLLYILIFGFGSVAGMMAMSALVGVPLHLAATRFTRAHFVVRGLAGLFSFAFGCFMAYEIGYVEGLFR